MDRPLRIAFDIGGVLSKYPDELRRMALCLEAGGAEVFVITDMHDHGDVVHTLRLNGFDFIRPVNVHCADYTTHGEGCKAEILREIGIDVFLDDFVGYVAEPGCPVRCLVMPDSTRPYYHDSWKTTGAEADFGRRVYRKEPSGPDLFFVRYDLLGRTHLAGPDHWNALQPQYVEILNLDGAMNVQIVEAAEVMRHG